MSYPDILNDKLDDQFDMFLNMEHELNSNNNIKSGFCYDCGGKIIKNNNNGNFVCTLCGLVCDGVIEEGPNTGFDEEGERFNGIINPFLPLSSLGTEMGKNVNKNIKRMHFWHRMPYKERSLHIICKKIMFKCQNGHLEKNIEDDAKFIYKKISECTHKKGKNKGKKVIIRRTNKESIIADCVYYSCKRNKATRTPKEIAKIFGLKQNNITRGCKTITKLLKNQNILDNIDSSNASREFIIRFCKELNFDQSFILQTLSLNDNIKKLMIISDHTPHSLAICSILLNAEYNNVNCISKKLLAFRFSISEVTINKALSKINKFKHIIFDPQLVDTIINTKTPILISKKLADQFNKFNIVIPDICQIIS